MKTKLLLLFLILGFCVFGQKHDNIWPLSYYWSPIGPYYYLDFSNGNPDTVVYQRDMSFFLTNASISDSTGSILFYTNGQWIADKNNDTLQGSVDFNDAYGTSSITDGLDICQGAIFLPISDSIYYLVHNSLDTFTNKDGAHDAQPVNLKYTLIDKSLNNGNGGVVTGYKGINVINDTLLLGRISATRHANGRDWWVLVHKYYSDLYYTLLFTPQGVLGPFSQAIGSIVKPKAILGLDNDLAGMALFSPDGIKYVNIDYDTLQFFNFDRCSGMLSNFYSIDQIPCDSFRLTGCSFSSDSKFLYANTRLKAFQFNTDTSNINASVKLIAVYDGFSAPGNTWFFLNQLGPDGKIYISTWGGNRVLSVIENPDSSSLSCNFNQHGFALPMNYGGNNSVPNFPNYRLGSLIGSPCDTLTNLVPELSLNVSAISIVPNPNNGNFIVNYSLLKNKAGTLQILNLMGRQIFIQSLPQWSVMQHLNFTNLAAGIYVLKISSGLENRFVKFIKD